MKKKILITGASGFIGSTVVEKALEAGFDTWAGVRGSSSMQYLQDPKINFIDLNYPDKDLLKSQLREFSAQNGKFDHIVHCAGLTKALHKSEFDKVNYEQVRNFADALIETDTVPDSFIFMSTLGVVGLGDEIGYSPIMQSQMPNPNTAYGKSKLKAENHIKSIPDFPYVILRPTGVYGPRDRDYLILIKSIRNGIEAGAGFRKQVLSFIYVDDLVKIIFDSIEKGVFRREYNVTDGQSYTDSEFNEIVKAVLNKRRTLKLKLPLPIVWIAAKINENVSQLTGKATTFNSDKYKIMKQRNWNCDITPLREELGFEADFPLHRGVEETIKWYRKEGWL